MFCNREERDSTQILFPSHPSLTHTDEMGGHGHGNGAAAPAVPGEVSGEGARKKESARARGENDDCATHTHTRRRRRRLHAPSHGGAGASARVWPTPAASSSRRAVRDGTRAGRGESKARRPHFRGLPCPSTAEGRPAPRGHCGSGRAPSVCVDPALTSSERARVGARGRVQSWLPCRRRQTARGGTPCLFWPRDCVGSARRAPAPVRTPTAARFRRGDVQAVSRRRGG
jgi:hypothetical protein